MRFSGVAIAGLAHVDPPIRVPTEELATRLGPFLDRIGLPRRALQGLSGIVARRFWTEGKRPSDAATDAARAAISAAGVANDRIGILVNTSVCRDWVEPSTASIVHGNLDLHAGCRNFDVANACLGFLSGMDLVAVMIERGDVDYGLIVDGEGSRFVTDQTIARLLADGTVDDFRAEFAALTLGSGAAAMVLARAELVSAAGRPVHTYKGGLSLAASDQNHLCRGNDDKMVTDSNGLLHAGIGLAEQTWAKGCEDFGWHSGYFDEYCLHQVSKVHTDKLLKRLGLDPQRTLSIVSEFGNIGPAAVPIVLSKAVAAGRIGSGSTVGLFGIGSGLNCAMVEVAW